MPDALPTLIVLDSWPLIEWLKGRQPAKKEMAAIFDGALHGLCSLSISRINLGELIYIGRKEIGLSEADTSHILDTFRDLPIRVVSATDVRVDAAVDIKSRYKVSYADAFAVALSVELGAHLLTGDKELRRLEADGIVRLLWVGT